MSDQEIIHVLLERAQISYPIAIAVNTILVKELSEKEPCKYHDIIDQMVEQKLVKNTFGDYVRILSRGTSIVQSGGYLKYIEQNPIEFPVYIPGVNIKEKRAIPSFIASRFSNELEWGPILISVIALAISLLAFTIIN